MNAAKRFLDKPFHLICAIALAAMLVPTAAFGASSGSTGEEAQSVSASSMEASTAETAIAAAKEQAASSSEATGEQTAAVDEEAAEQTADELDVAADDAADATDTAASSAAVVGAAASTMSEDKELKPQDARDLSQYLSGFDFTLLKYNNPGTTDLPGDGTTHITRYESLGVTTNWELHLPASEPGFQEGDTFSYVFDAVGITNWAANKTDEPFKVEGVERGKWSSHYDNGKITFTVTMNDTWPTGDRDIVKAGIKIEYIGQNWDNGNTVKGGTDFTKTLTIGVGDTVKNSHNYIVSAYTPTPSVITTKKDGKWAADLGSNKIQWTAPYGWPNMAALTASEGASYAGTDSKGQTFNPMNHDRNVIIDTLSYTDRLTNGTVKAISVDNINITSLIVPPSSLTSGNTVGNQAASLNAFHLEPQYTRVDGAAPAFADVSDFADSLQARQYGIYTAADGTLSVCVNFGKYGTSDTPTMEEAFGANWAGDLASEAISEGFYADADYDDLKAMITKIYGPGNVLGGHVPLLNLCFDAQYPLFDSNGEITTIASNHAESNHETIDDREISYSGVFSWGSLLPYQLKVFKYDEGTNAALKGAEFKLQKKDNGVWSDYTAQDTAVPNPPSGAGQLIRTTGDSGFAEWQALQAGDYRLVEVKAPDGYTLGAETPGAGGCVIDEFNCASEGADKGHRIAVPNSATKGALKVTKKVGVTLTEDTTFYAKVTGPNSYFKVIPLVVKAGDTSAEVALNNLEAGQYMISEVADELGNPLDNNTVVAGGHTFTASIDNDTVTVAAKTTVASTITNTAIDTKVTPVATKTLSGDLPVGLTGLFSAEITAKTAGAPMPASTRAMVTVSDNNETPFAGFDAITFTAPGTYEYEITEDGGSMPNVTYDTNTYTMTVVVDNAMNATVAYTGGTTAADKAQIKNTYTPQTSSTTPSGKPVVTVTKTVDKTTVKSGDELTYTLVVSNSGDADAVGIWVKDIVPANTTFISAESAVNTENGAVNWFVDKLAPGAMSTLSFKVRVNDNLGSDVNILNTVQYENTDNPTPPTDYSKTPSGGESNKVGTVVNPTSTPTTSSTATTSTATTTTAAATAARTATAATAAKTGDLPLVPIALGIAALCAAAVIALSRKHVKR